MQRGRQLQRMERTRMPSQTCLIRDSCTGLTPIDGVTRRDLISSAFGAALLAACRSDVGPSVSAVQSRTITNRFGTYQIPLKADRLILMGNRFDLETARALDLSPVAIGQEYAFRGGPAEYVAPWVPYTPSNIEVFNAREATIEYLLRLRPDLLFCQGQHLDGTQYRSYKSLSAVAPIVPTNLLPWREDLQQVAGWLNREERLADTFRQYDELRDAIKQRHARRIASARVAFGHVEPPSIWLRSLDDLHGPAARALADLGGQLLPLSVPLANDRGPGFYQIGQESLREIAAADAILLWAPDESIRAAFLENPLWPRLSAVQAGRAHQVDTGVWFDGGSATAAHRALDDLFRFVALSSL
jgi:iron complex transport system substrate-binding protein